MAKLSNLDVGRACLQLGMMSKAGLPLADAFDAMAGACGDRFPGPGYAGIARQIRDGEYPDKAMLDSGLFPRQCCGLVAAGHESGRLDEALPSLARYYERVGSLEARLKSTLMQPVAMLAMILAVFALVTVKILPVFDDVYASMGGSLDGLAGTMLSAGKFIRKSAPGFAAALGILSLAGALAYLARPARKFAAKAFGWALGDRWLWRTMNDARYLQALSMGLDAGMTSEESSRMAASLQEPGSRARMRYDSCSEALAKGAKISGVGLSHGIFDQASAMLADTGERSGCVPESVRNAAAMMLDKAEEKMDRAASMVEPVMTAIGSGLIGATVLAAMLPLLGVMNAMG